MASLDTELEMLLIRKAYYDQNPSSGRVEIGADDPLYIALKFRGDVNALVPLGFQPGSTVGSIAYGVTTLAGLEALARHPQVEFIERQRRVHTHLDGSVPDIKATQVWKRGGDNFSGYTGRGVIVGIIDTGIDFRHKAFRTADNKSRVLKIWDQTMTALTTEGPPDPITDVTIATTPTPLNYGVEYNKAQIDDTLLTPDPLFPVRHVDKDGHGSHVAGIAAGDGSQNGHCHGTYRYIGVATEADLMIVRLWGLTKGDANAPATGNGVLIDAIRYLVDQARQLNRPMAINLSLGKFTEKMDGTSAACQTIDTLLTTHSAGRAIVFSAGNDGDAGFHAAASVPAGVANPLRLNFTISPKDTKTRNLVVRYTGANLQAQITSPVPGAAGVVAWVPIGPAVSSPTANGVGGLVSVVNSANTIRVSIAPGPNRNNRAGSWRLELRNSAAAATPVDAFLLFGSSHDAKSPRFANAVTSRTTLNEHATGFETIAVGSYREGGGLSSFSSRGPTLDTPARPIPKPELAAPGEDIASAGLPSDRTGCQRCCCKCCQDFYVDKSGTSMSAPHVTGVIALMLHKNPALTHVEIRNLLTGNTSPKPGNSTPDEDAGWGRGRLDAKQVLDAVAQVNAPVALAVTDPAPDDASLAQVREALLGTDRGPQLAGLFERYGGEVWSLIQGNRRVATIWHRCKGPIWVRLALKAVYAPEIAMRLEVDGLRLHDALRRFAGALKRFGSPALRGAVEAWEAEFELIQDGMNLRAIIEAVGNQAGGPEPLVVPA